MEALLPVGHIRLGQIPRTRKWARVIGLIDQGPSQAATTAATIAQIASDRFKLLHNDKSMAYVYWLISRIVFHSRSQDFLEALSSDGIVLRGVTGLDFLSAVNQLAEKEARRRAGQSIFHILALRSFRETLGKLVHEHSNTLFGTTLDDVRSALRIASTERGFARLSRGFFTSFLFGFFDFIISKEASDHVGWGKPLTSVDEHADARDELRIYCFETTRILEEFAGGWFSKHNWLDDLTEERARGFIDYAATKLESELARELSRE